MEVLKACYQFSMMARLAPKWNRVSSYLIQGSELANYLTCYSVIH